jgi:putative ABC transport system substrate-binding protein
MRRRDFITLIGGAVAWPLAARAQQPGLPLVGYVGARPQAATAPPALVEGLAEMGYVVGQNLRIEYRWTESPAQIPSVVADLVRLQPAAILASGSATALAAKMATSKIPIVFATGDDAVRLGLVTSLNRPGGNLTGATNNNVELEGKRLALMHDILPAGQAIVALVETNNPAVERQASDIEDAARSLGRKVRILKVASEGEIDAAFDSIVKDQLGALFVAASAYFATRRSQIVTLATHFKIPSVYSRREDAEAGGLVSYGTDLSAESRQLGIYLGRVLKGEKPSDLPVVQGAKFELVVNLKTAKALGLTIPQTILVAADEVIE